MGDVRIGTSGWSYPSGPGTWNGIFYPSRRSRPAGRLAKADDLAYYAEHFDTVEVNSSFYRPARPGGDHEVGRADAGAISTSA